MSRDIAPGSTNVSTRLLALDADGLPVDVDHETAGLALWYQRGSGPRVTITPAELPSGLDSAHVDGGVCPIGDGYTRVDLPDAACASGATDLLIGGSADDVTFVAAVHALVEPAAEPSGEVTGFTAAALAQLVGARIALVEQVFLAGRQLVLVKGSSSLVAHGGGIRFHLDNPPDLTDATVVLWASRNALGAAQTFSLTGAFDVINETRTDAVFEYTAAGIADVAVGQYEFRLNITFSGGAVWTPVITVPPDRTARVIVVDL